MMKRRRLYTAGVGGSIFAYSNLRIANERRCDVPHLEATLASPSHRRPLGIRMIHGTSDEKSCFTFETLMIHSDLPTFLQVAECCQKSNQELVYGKENE